MGGNKRTAITQGAGAKSNGLVRLSLRPKPKESSWYQTQPTHPTERGLSQMTWRR